MKILVAIVHYWNPEAGGRHASLRSNPQPRIMALQEQLLCLLRLSNHQGAIDIGAMSVSDANHAIRHVFDLCVVTDGVHTILNHLPSALRSLLHEEIRTPLTPKHLGFEAQKLLAENIDEDYDLLVYLEDDLLIHDPYFFHKISWFGRQLGSDHLLLPQRMEIAAGVHLVDRLFIDGALPAAELHKVIPDPPPSLSIQMPTGSVYFESPRNPHAGCFALTPNQMRLWAEADCWQDGDCSYVSPLESAATLGLLKIFRLYKPAFACASWLEIQHWGTSFSSLVGASVKPPRSVDGEANC
ncbi:calcium-binding protein [Synechococcus sp. N26]|uniref:calcium-binding protein n=1 Tax=Synechococcus sp. N26 TaxID=2575513 RepID=UPI0010BDA5E8|nr:calcium-binding protein [Synechococcus sp. N26]